MQSVGFVFLLFLLAPITQYNVFMPPIGLRLLSRRPSHLNLQFDYSALFHWFRAYFVWVSGDGGGIRREHEVWCAFVLCFARLLVGRIWTWLTAGNYRQTDTILPPLLSCTLQHCP